jgi:hypothetical protein
MSDMDVSAADLQAVVHIAERLGLAGVVFGGDSLLCPRLVGLIKASGFKCWPDRDGSSLSHCPKFGR